MVIIVKNITEDRSTINDTSTDPIEDNTNTHRAYSDKKDYTVKLGQYIQVRPHLEQYCRTTIVFRML